MNKTSKGKSVISIISIGLWFILGQSPDVLATGVEDVKRGVVKIEAKKPGGVIDTGAGIILSTTDQVIYILTAYHVIDGALNVTVTFRNRPVTKIAAKLFEKYDQENDLAVVYIESSVISKEISILHLGDVSKTKELDKVIAIGHPSNSQWELSTAVIRASEPSKFRFSGDAVDPGNSGGALLNKEFQLIGLITKERPGNGIALKIDHAIKILKNWQIPYAFELERRSKKWPWIVAAGGVAAGIATAVILGRGKGKGTLAITVADPPN